MKPLTIPLILLLICSCTRTVYVPVESTSRSSLISDNISLRADTVILRDTVCITVTQAGDTIRTETVRWRQRFINRIDTVSILRTDTVSKQIPVEIRVPMSESTLSRIWKYAVAIFIGAAVMLMIILRSRLGATK